MKKREAAPGATTPPLLAEYLHQQLAGGAVVVDVWRMRASMRLKPRAKSPSSSSVRAAAAAERSPASARDMTESRASAGRRTKRRKRRYVPDVMSATATSVISIAALS